MSPARIPRSAGLKRERWHRIVLVIGELSSAGVGRV